MDLIIVEDSSTSEKWQQEQRQLATNLFERPAKKGQGAPHFLFGYSNMDADPHFLESLTIRLRLFKSAQT